MDGHSFHSGVPVERVDYSNTKKSNDAETFEKNCEIEELKVNNEDLRRHIHQLLKEVDDLKKENCELTDRLESAHTLFTDVGGSGIEMIPDLPPLEMPQFDFDLLEAQNRTTDNETDTTLRNHSFDSCL